MKEENIISLLTKQYFMISAIKKIKFPEKYDRYAQGLLQIFAITYYNFSSFKKKSVRIQVQV